MKLVTSRIKQMKRNLMSLKVR